MQFSQNNIIIFIPSHINLSLNKMTTQDMRKNDKTTNYMTEGDIKHWEKI